jgi:hypothetical protein
VSLRRGVCIAGSAGAELGGVTWFRAGGGTSPLSGGVVDCCAQASPIEPNTAMVTAVEARNFDAFMFHSPGVRLIVAGLRRWD